MQAREKNSPETFPCYCYRFHRALFSLLDYISLWCKKKKKTPPSSSNCYLVIQHQQCEKSSRKVSWCKVRFFSMNFCMKKKFQFLMWAWSSCSRIRCRPAEGFIPNSDCGPQHGVRILTPLRCCDCSDAWKKSSLCGHVLWINPGEKKTGLYWSGHSRIVMSK